MVKPEGAVTDFRTAITGHTAADLEGVAYSRAAAQQDLLRHLVGQVRPAAAALPLDLVLTFWACRQRPITLPGTVSCASGHVSMHGACCPQQQLPPRCPTWNALKLQGGRSPLRRAHTISLAIHNAAPWKLPALSCCGWPNMLYIATTPAPGARS